MKDKNLLDDIKNKSLNELTELANNIIEKLENEKDLENSVNEYQNLLKLNNLGISSIINDGNQCQSWIHIDDLVNIFLFTSLNNINGKVNGVAPSPVSFKELQNNISSNYKKPLLSLNFPKWLLKIPLSFLGLSDFYNDIIGSNKRVSSKKIQDLGYKFIYPSLDKLK